MSQAELPLPPPTMRALALHRFGNPETYDIATVPTPKITQPDEVLIKVEAASINPVDVKLANGYVYYLVIIWIGKGGR